MSTLEHIGDRLSPSELRVGWIMPPFFHELPVNAADSDAAADRLHELATTVLPDHSADDQLMFALQLGAQIEPMVEAGVLYAGLCFLEADGQPTSSTVLVTQFEHDSNDEEIISTLTDTLSRAYPRDEIDQISLTCGQAVSRIGQSPFSFENPGTGTTERVQRSIIQAYVPMPGTAEILLFELGVFSADGWDLHSEVFAEILKTIDWGTDAEISEAAELSQRKAKGSLESVSKAIKVQLTDICRELVGHSTGYDLFDRGDESFSATPCHQCWDRGLRSACRSALTWRLSGWPAEALETILERGEALLTNRNWSKDVSGSGGGVVRLNVEEYSLAVYAEADAGGIRVELETACARLAKTDVSDDFG